MSRHFDPPYDSPLEEAFAWTLSKVLLETAMVEKQFIVPTQFSTFRLDLLISGGARRVGIELDGAEFHKNRHCQDYTRDALILHEGACDVIYRIEGKDAFHRPFACLDFMTEEDISIFSDRGLSLLAKELKREREEAAMKMPFSPFIHRRRIPESRDIWHFLQLVEKTKCSTLEQAERIAVTPAREIGKGF